MSISLTKRMCSSLSDALETEPVLMTEEPYAAALPDLSLAAFILLVVAALFVAAWGSGLARLLRPDPPGVRPALLPS